MARSKGKTRGARPVTTAAKRLFAAQPEFLEDLDYWVEHDHNLASRLLRIVRETLRAPFEGIGKPEPLRFLGPNVWSRRLNREHRIVYVVHDDRIEFTTARYHYQ
jgi:toxin YoeB